MSRGNRTPDFFSFDPTWETWCSLATVPPDDHGKFFGKGSRATCDGASCVYAARGGNSADFLRYDIAEDSWFSMPPVPRGSSTRGVRGGSDLVFAGGNGAGSVYLLRNGLGESYRFDVESARWESLPSPPATLNPRWKDGSWIVFDGDSLIYAHKSYFHELWTYNTRSRVWTLKKAGMPFTGYMAKSKKSKAGGCATWYDDHIYALKGGNTTEFWCYRPDPDTWIERDTIRSFGSTGKKKRVHAGADVASVLGVVFALKGNKTRELWDYGPYGQSGCDGSATRGTPKRTPMPGAHATILGAAYVHSGTRPAELVDATGRRVMAILPGTNDLSSLPAGVYSVVSNSADVTRILILR